MARIQEKMGDRPAWMRIKDYRAEGRRAELVLSLGKKKKDYWFPVSPTVYERFRGKIQESRLAGLRYLQAYIRQYRGYAGYWPSKRYVERNKLRKASLQESLAATAIKLFSEHVSIADISKQTLLPVEIVTKLLQVSGKLTNPANPCND